MMAKKIKYKNSAAVDGFGDGSLPQKILQMEKLMVLHEFCFV
jgi:hypothetical protein